MKKKILAIMALGMLTGSVTALAEPVVWELRGTITQAAGIHSNSLGQTFVALMGFDSDAQLLATRTGGRFDPGARYEFDPSSLYFDVSVGGGSVVRYMADTTNGFPLIYQRDNSGDLDGIERPVTDGYTFAADSPAVLAGWAIRGSILDIVDGPGLPTNPDPRLLSLETNSFFISEVDATGFQIGFLGGPVTAVERIVEPEQMLSSLISQILALNIQAGIGQGFDSKLQNALDALDRAQNGDVAAARGMLDAFVQSVEAQRGKALTDEQADQLVAAAQAIIEALD